MSKIRLAVLFGGVSGEHEVSCMSAASILSHLDAHRYEVTAIGITKEGRWFVQPRWSGGPLAVVADAAQEVVVRPGAGLAIGTKPLAVDVVFPIAHGIQGEDGKLQGLLECAGLPYCGAGVLSSAVGMDKDFAKQLWRAHGLPVVPSVTLRPGDVATPGAQADAYARAVRELGTPLFVKPANSGSSVGVAKVASAAEFGPALELAFSVDPKALVETAVDAREIEVAVLDRQGLKAYGPGEVVPTHTFYDYEAKYTDPDGADLVIPAALAPEVHRRIVDLAVRASVCLELEGFARVDFFVDRKTNEVWLNEINTLPGFTTISMFPRMAVAGGLTYAQVLDAIVDEALAAR